MLSSLPRPIFPGGDPCLEPYLQAASPTAADLALERLMEEAAPLVTDFLRRKIRRYSRVELEDAASETRVQLATSLQRLRASHGRPIADFRAYVCAVANTAWATLLRQQNPARAMLSSRLHYLLGNTTGQRGFARWAGADGRQWAGFEAWEGQGDAGSHSTRRRKLQDDPATAAAEAFGGSQVWTDIKLPSLVAGLLSWLDAPLPLRELTDALAFLLGMASDAASLDGPGADSAVASALAETAPSPQEALRWKEYLGWLWQTSAQLNVAQGRAFLLHSSCLHEMEFLGLTSIRHAASRLELPLQDMGEFWIDLPLEDRVIAVLLGVECQRVVNLRKAARVILGRAWLDFSR